MCGTNESNKFISTYYVLFNSLDVNLSNSLVSLNLDFTNSSPMSVGVVDVVLIFPRRAFLLVWRD